MLSYLVAGGLSLAWPPGANGEFGPHAVPEEAVCLRASRHADYVSVDLPMGTPVNIVSLLLRLDQVVERSDSVTNARVFSNRVAESSTVQCTGSLCSDVALLQTTGPGGAHERAVVRFQYSNSQNEALAFSTASVLGLGGEMSLARGFDYYLTATHFCWFNTNSSEEAQAQAGAEDEGALAASTRDGTLRTNASQLLAGSQTIRSTPVGLAHRLGHCGVSEIALFPGSAGDEAAWLGLSSTRAYEASPEGVDDRRRVVEVGTSCAAAHDSYASAYSLYQLDCQSVYTPCETHPSIPFRRVASDEIRVHTSNDGSHIAYVWTVPDSRLLGLPKLEEASSAFWLSVLKLLMMTLAAAITWIRAAKSTSSHHQLFMFCVRSAHCDESEKEPVRRHVVREDRLIGLLAIAARGGVALWRIETLAHDGQMRVAVVQLVATGLSLLQWATRYYVLQWRCESPLTKLGGSTALCDATSAVMLAFAEPPLMVTSIGRFDPTARLLTALLLTIVTLQRCAFASACCGLLWVVVSEDVERAAQQKDNERRFSQAYVPILLFASLCWILQAAAVAILLGDIFAVPLAHSASRGMVGDWNTHAFAVFLAVTAAGLPQLMKTAEKVAQDPVFKKKEGS
jgi:hypothetical protein